MEGDEEARTRGGKEEEKGATEVKKEPGMGETRRMRGRNGSM